MKLAPTYIAAAPRGWADHRPPSPPRSLLQVRLTSIHPISPSLSWLLHVPEARCYIRGFHALFQPDSRCEDAGAGTPAPANTSAPKLFALLQDVSRMVGEGKVTLERG